MKNTRWTFLAVLLAAGLAAPTFAADPPVFPADPPPSPPKSDSKKKTAKPAAKGTATKPAAKKANDVVPFPSPEPAVVSQKNVNVRGQARINSEVVSHLNKGDKITVLEEITTAKKPNEPDKWYKISMPSSAPAWVFASFVDADKKVKPSKLNLRSGPGENYSIVGTIEKGTAVNVLETKGDWHKIEPPAGAYAFVAAHLVTLQPAAPPTEIVSNTKPLPPVVETPVAPPTAVATPTDPPPPPPIVAPPLVPVVQPKPTGPPPEEPLGKRVVSREGIIKSSVSIQAPSHYVLRGLENNKTINYLTSPTANDVVKNFWGKRVFVTGEEVLDERWPNTPVIEVETIQEIESPESPEAPK